MFTEADKKLLFLFGLPGSGKNYVGESLAQESYGFYFYDSDKDHTPRQQEAKRLGIMFDRPMRDEFYAVIKPKVQDLLNECGKLTVASFFPYDDHRRLYLKEFPMSKFVLIETDPEIRMRRIQERWEQDKKAMPPKLAIEMSKQFEQISVPHTIIRNDGNKESLRAQIDVLMRSI